MLSFVVFLVAGLVGLIQVFSGCSFLAGPPGISGVPQSLS